MRAPLLFAFGFTFAAAAVTLLACGDDTPQTYGPTYGKDSGQDGTVGDGGPTSDVAVDAPADGALLDAPPDAPACGSTTVILGGNGSSLFGGGGGGSAALVTATLPGSVADRIAVAPYGTGFVAALRATGGALESTVFTTSWADPAPIAARTARDAPALASIGAVVHLVYQSNDADAGVDYKYFHGQYASDAWDSADDPVGGGGNSQSYGPRAPGAAAVGTDLVIAQAGDNSVLYDQTWSSTWQAAHGQNAAAIQKDIPPTIVALTGGSADLMIAYMRDGDYKIMSVTRSGGTWSAPVLVNTTAYANDPVAVAPMAGGKAILVFRGTDMKPYFSLYDGQGAWSAPAAVVAQSSPTVASTPSVATGVCGDDAVIAYAANGGGVELVHLQGGAPLPPVQVSGTTGAQFVAVATRP